MVTNNDADDDGVARRLPDLLRQASRLERASEHDD
jgi:hypothetical protein